MAGSPDVSDAPGFSAAVAADDVPRFELRGLAVSRGGRRVLEQLSFAVHRGEAFGLLGPNGAGKTTTFQVLTGLLASTSGAILLDGKPLAPQQRDFRARTGVVFQDPALDARLSARQNLALVASMYAVPRAVARERITELLDRAELADRADEPVARFSGGMRRRVELARALVHEPDILILDEPTSGLDEGAFRRFWKHLMALRDERGLTLLLTTHRADEAALCDRLAILDQGRIIACDTPDGLRSRVRGEVLILEAEQPDDVASGLARRFDFEIQRVDDRLVIQRDDAHTLVPRIVEALPEGSLRSVSIRRAGLGEVFLRLTGRDLDAESPTEATP